MKVAIYGSCNRTPTGPDRMARGIAYAIAIQGHDVDLVTHGDGVQHEHNRVKIRHVNGGSDSVANWIQSRMRVSRFITRGDYDIFHSVTGTVADVDVLTVGGIFDSLEIYLSDYKNDDSFREFLGGNIYDMLKIIGILRSGTTVATSPMSKRQLSYVGKHVDIVPLGIKSNFRTPPISVSDPIRVLIPGRLETKKGQVRVLKHLNPQDERYLVDIVGTYPEGYIDRNDLGEWRERIHGYVSDDKLETMYEAADIVVVPSYHENFAFTALEGAAKGCAVITGPRVGFGQFDIEGVNVRDSGKQMAILVESLCDKREILNEKKRDAFRDTEAFTWETIGRTYTEAVYPKVE